MHTQAACRKDVRSGTVVALSHGALAAPHYTRRTCQRPSSILTSGTSGSNTTEAQMFGVFRQPRHPWRTRGINEDTAPDKGAQQSC
eukprot:scaffold218220_cov32-Tisochrysis_lutea.AAC.2